MATKFTMRPHFMLSNNKDPQSLFKALRAALSDPNIPYVGQVLDRHAFLQLPKDQRTLLSPFLNLNIIEVDGEQRVHCSFTPQPAVWTGFMAIYGVLAMVALSGMVLGIAKLMLNDTPWTMLALPVCGATAAFVYGAALIGQGLTLDQMYALRVFVERLARGEDLPRNQGNIV